MASTTQPTQIFSLKSPFVTKMTFLVGLLSFGLAAFYFSMTKSVRPTLLVVMFPIITFVAILAISLKQSWRNVTGKEVQIEGDQVHLISSNNKLTFAAPIASITKLRSIKPMFARNPEAFCVEFNDGHKFYFRDDIPNRESFMQLLEQKSGLKFEIRK
jgi:hypothetical protein